MAYIAPIHRPSSVRHALKLRFIDPEEDCLVLAKSNRLEFWTQSDDDGLLQLRSSCTLHGKVTLLQRINPSSSPTEHLVVGTNRYQYFTLAWDVEKKRPVTVRTYIDLSDPTARDVQTQQRCLVDPAEEFMTLEVYEGIITTIPLKRRETKGKNRAVLEDGVLGEAIPYRIPEFIVRSSAFLPRPPHKGEKPKHALLYEEFESRVRLRIRELSYAAGSDASVEFKDDFEKHPILDMDPGANILIPVHAPPYGLLILAETRISYFDEETFTIIHRPLEEATSFSTWERIDDQRYVLGDTYGRLYLLMLNLDFESKIEDWQLDVLGEIPVASSLVYLDGGLVFVGSHQGDSKLVRIVETKDGGSIETVQSFSNIAPVLDFTIMDMGNRSGEGQTNEYSSGQARIVTGSGAFADGSLRSVRSGVGMQELGVIGEMQGITDVFSLRTNATAEFDNALLVSFVGESRAFTFDPQGGVEEQESYGGLTLDTQTLLASSLPGGLLLQVTPSKVLLLDAESGMSQASWDSPSGTITAVSATESHLLVTVDGSSLHVFDLRKDLTEVVSRQFAVQEQLSCVAVSPELPSACIVGHWKGSAISVLSLSDLTTIETMAVSDDPVATPRNLLVVRLHEAPQPPTLLVATADGNVTTFDVDVSSHKLTSKKSTILGTQEAGFKAIPRGNGLMSVFATCEHPSLIYSTEGRIVFSAVSAGTTVSVAPFDAEAYPGAVVIATSNDLGIAIIDTERTTHVQTLAVGETVRRIAYSPNLRAFGLGTIKLKLQDGVETLLSHFKLADEVLFKELDTFRLNSNEVVETVIRAELSDGTGDTAERFLIGTSIVDDDDVTDHHGRIIVFEVTEDRILKRIAEQSVRGACRRLAVLDGKIIAALVKTIVVFDFKYPTASNPVFVKTATYRTATAPIDISLYGKQIAVADLMKSVSILEYRPQSKAAGMQDELIETHRHYHTMWTTAVSSIGEDMWLVADSEDNIVVLNRDREGATEDDMRRLRVTSEMCLGEMVNCIRPVEVVSQKDAPVVPRAFLGTVEGAVYLLGLISPSHQNVLIELQNNLSGLTYREWTTNASTLAAGTEPGTAFTQLDNPGHIDFQEFRGFKNQVRQMEEPVRFVDGEFIERFLELDGQLAEKAVENLGPQWGVAEVRELVEGLKRLH